MTTDTTRVDPRDIAKGARVRISDLPDTTVYVIDAVRRRSETFYAVSQDMRSGHWWDFTDIREVLAD